MQNVHKKKRINASLFHKGIRLIIDALEHFVLLLLEVFLHPRWLPHKASWVRSSIFLKQISCLTCL